MKKGSIHIGYPQKDQTPIGVQPLTYRGRLYSAQSILKKDPGRTRQKSLATAGTNFTKPGVHDKVDLCM